MIFVGVNYLAILVAAVAAWLAGAVWYTGLGEAWLAALGKTRADMEEARDKPGYWLPFVYSFLANLVMAWVLAGLIGHLGAGAFTLANGMISALFCWLGFIATTLLVNNSFARRSARLLWIDGGHWLVVLLLMGAIIGAWGV